MERARGKGEGEFNFHRPSKSLLYTTHNTPDTFVTFRVRVGITDPWEPMSGTIAVSSNSHATGSLSKTGHAQIRMTGGSSRAQTSEYSGVMGY